MEGRIICFHNSSYQEVDEKTKKGIHIQKEKEKKQNRTSENQWK